MLGKEQRVFNLGLAPKPEEPWLTPALRAGTGLETN